MRYADWQGWAAFLNERAFRDGPSTLDPGSHYANGIWLNPEADYVRLALNTEPTTLYIGHAPGTDHYFDGTITKLGIDPPCVSQ